ncbi:hypothetical protein GA0061077_0760, partial [Bifidobacterium commune]
MKESDISRVPFCFHGVISIDAPAKGATACVALDPSWDAISIHAPKKGATNVNDCLINSSGFQSTLPRRERPA